MTLEFAQMQRLCEIVCEKRANVTGHRLSGPDTTAWPSEVDSDALFARLVTLMYLWFYESWGDEVNYLIGTAATVGVATPEVRRFSGLIVDLRTSQQHNSTSDSLRRTRRWIHGVIGVETPTSGEQWERCAHNLLTSCKLALSDLIEVIKAVAVDISAAGAWSARVVAATSNDPAAQLSVVLADIGLEPSPSQRRHLKLQIDHDWRRRLSALTGADDAEAELANTVERIVVGWSISALPCRYDEILEAVDARPGVEAVGALEFAHALVDLCDFDSQDEFIDCFVRAWDAVQNA